MKVTTTGLPPHLEAFHQALILDWQHTNREVMELRMTEEWSAALLRNRQARVALVNFEARHGLGVCA